MRWLKPARAVWIAASVLASIFVARFTTYWFDGRSHGFAITVFTSIQMAILWGCLAAYALHSQRGFEAIWKLLRYRFAVALIAMGALAALAWMQRPHAVVHFLFAALVVGSIVREDNAAASILQNRLVQHVGRVSYGAYLLHNIAYGLLRMLGVQLRDTKSFYLSVILTVLMASISYRAFEGFFLKKKQQFSA
jgi:peptidoglycan/LPS O-acetylase OafA/YrhL